MPRQPYKLDSSTTAARAFQPLAEPPARTFGSPGPYNGFKIEARIITAGLNLHRANAPPSQATGMGLEAGKERSAQRLAGLYKTSAF